MADFERLGLEIVAKDSATKTLSKVVELLKDIKTNANVNVGKIDLGGINNISKTTSNNFKEIQKSAQTMATNLGENINIATGATEKLKASTLSYNNSLLSAQNAQINYNQSLLNQEKTILALENAKKQLVIAESNYLNIQNKTISSNAEIERARLRVEKATNNVANATILSAKADENVVKSQNNAIKSTNNLEKAKIKLNESTKKNVDLNLRSVVSFAALFAIVRKTSRMFATIVKESGAYVENLNLFAITFGKEYQKTLDWSLQLSKNLGLSSNELIKFTGLFKQLATSIGVADATGTQMSKTLTQLGLDLSSFYNIDITTAMEKLQAGIFSGQTKPLIFGGIIKRFIMKKLCEPRNLGCEQYQIAC